MLCWPPEIIQQAIPNGPIHHSQYQMYIVQYTYERTCELAFHEANQVRFLVYVQWCDLSNESNDYKKNNGYRTNYHASCII